MMENGLQEPRDNPKALLLPGTLPIPVHTIIRTNEDSDSEENLPSTIDMDALKGPGPAESTFQSISWRTPSVKKPHELPKKDLASKNGLDVRTSLHSESTRSAISNASSSPSDNSDSESGDSDSSSNSEGTTAGSSDSSDSSDSDSVDSEPHQVQANAPKTAPMDPMPYFSDPVLFNAMKNSDLTIFPINSPVNSTIPSSSTLKTQPQTQASTQMGWTSTSGNVVITPNSGVITTGAASGTQRFQNTSTTKPHYKMRKPEEAEQKQLGIKSDDKTTDDKLGQLELKLQSPPIAKVSKNKLSVLLPRARFIVKAKNAKSSSKVFLKGNKNGLLPSGESTKSASDSDEKISKQKCMPIAKVEDNKVSARASTSATPVTPTAAMTPRQRYSRGAKKHPTAAQPPLVINSIANTNGSVQRIESSGRTLTQLETSAGASPLPSRVLSSPSPSPSSLPLPSLRTKGAKKYIPDEEQLQRHEHKSKSLVRKNCADDSQSSRLMKTNSKTKKNKKHKSKSRRQSRSRDSVRRSRNRVEDKAVKELCEKFKSQCQIKGRGTSSSRRGEKNRSIDKRGPFAFSTRATRGAAGSRVQTMKEFLTGIGFSMYGSGSGGGAVGRNQNQPSKLTNGHSHGSSSGRKRRAPGCDSPGKSNLNSVIDNEVPSLFENPKLQRLPIKKRHIQASKSSSDLALMDSSIPSDSPRPVGSSLFGATFFDSVALPSAHTSKNAPIFGQLKRGRPVDSTPQDFSELYKKKHHKNSSSRSPQKAITPKPTSPKATTTTPKPISPKATTTTPKSMSPVPTPSTSALAVTVTNGPSASKETNFTSSLTERVKIRKRVSVDGNQQLDKTVIESLEVLGVSPALLNVPDPPIILPVKTNYLKAGLMSTYYKYPTEGEGPEVEELMEEGNEVQRIIPGGLLPQPAYAKAYAMERIIDYILPYDIWCLGVLRARDTYEDWKQEQDILKAQEKAQRKLATRRKSDSATVARPRKVPMPDIIPDSWNFKKIRSNTYYGLSKPPVTTEPEVDQLCECPSGEFKCAGEDCLNRLVFTECPPACGENCRNRRIQKHDWAPELKRFLTENKGYGVLCRLPIKKGDFILEYVGEVVSDAVFKERMHTIYANDTHHYCLQLDSGRVIDGHRSGGEGRFVNHSCDPNCEMQKWSVNGLSRMALFALRDIKPDEELSYDYNFSLYNPAEGQPCHCKGPNCRGVIGGRTQYKSDMSAASKRKSGNTKGSHGMGTIVWGRRAASSVLDKMKILSRKEKNYMVTHRLFLFRNYEKIRRKRDEVDDQFGDRLEKIMSSWILRFKAGSSKNKAIILPEDDEKLASLARVAQILYELYANLIKAKDENGKCLCEPFMESPSKKRYPNFYTAYEASHNSYKLKGLKALEKGILRGDYKSLQALEVDIGAVINSFSNAYETEKPEINSIVEKIKSVYKKGKQKAVQALDPFIIQHGNPQLALASAPRTISALPRFARNLDFGNEDIIRCICGTFSEEGMMVICEKCNVWQHCDCMRYPYDPEDAETSMLNARRLEKAKEKATGNKKGRGRPVKIKTPNHRNRKLSDCDEKEKVELDTGVIISVKDELLVLEKEEDPDPLVNGCVQDEIPLSEMETQVLDVIYEDPMEIAKAVEVRKGSDYYCEKCKPRPVNPEVPMGGPGDTPDRIYHLTLLREDGLLLRKNDNVYVLRDWTPEQKIGPDGRQLPRKTYKTAGTIVKSECDIFRIQELYRDSKGNGYAYGYNYLRPYETFHEPSRRFYPNEVLRAPIIEQVEIELIHGICWVVDSATYCKGRPKGCVEEDLYICDFRVDKAARAFSKVGKNSQVICTRPYAFDYFETKLKIQRNLHPHGPPSPDFKGTVGNAEKPKGRKTDEKAKYKTLTSLHEIDPKKKAERRERLNRVTGNLHTRIDGFSTEPVDLSHLLISSTTTTSSGRKKPNWNKKLSF